MPERQERGFTLIELMIAIAIIGVLVALAVPTYQNYLLRSQVTEGMSLSTQAKAAMLEYYTEHGRWPASNADAGLPPAIVGTYVSAIDVGAMPGTITITYGGDKVNAELQNKTLLLQAHPGQGAVTWTCKPGTRNGIKKEALPAACA